MLFPASLTLSNSRANLASEEVGSHAPGCPSAVREDELGAGRCASGVEVTGGRDRPFVSHRPHLPHSHGLKGLRQETVGCLGLLLAEVEVERGFRGCICSVRVEQSYSGCSSAPNGSCCPFPASTKEAPLQRAPSVTAHRTCETLQCLDGDKGRV